MQHILNGRKQDTHRGHRSKHVESCNDFTTIHRTSGINQMDVKSKETSSSNVMIEPQEQIFISDLCCGPPVLGRGYMFQRADRHYYILCFIHPCFTGLQ